MSAADALVVGFAGILVSRLAAYHLAVLRSHMRFAHYAMAGLASSVFLFSAVAVLHFRGELSILAVVTLVLLGAPAVKLVVAVVGTPRTTWNLVAEAVPFGEILDFGKWVWGTSLLEAAARRGNVLLVKLIAGDAATGYFELAARFAEFLGLIFEPVRSYLLPRLSALSSLRSIAAAMRKTYSRLAWTLLLLPPAWLAADPVFRVVAGPGWAPAAVVFQILVTARLMFLLSAPLSFVTFALRRPRVQTLIYLGALVIFLVVADPLITSYGAVGGAAAMLVFSATLLCAFIVYTWRVVRDVPTPIPATARSTGWESARAASRESSG